MSITVEQLNKEILGLKGQQQQVQNQFHQIVGAIALLEQLHKQLTAPLEEVKPQEDAAPKEKPKNNKATSKAA